MDPGFDEDMEDLVSGDEAHLGNAVRVTEGDTNPRGVNFAGEFDAG